jgi:RNA polymerase sigma-70 factor, ECF subfamily
MIVIVLPDVAADQHLLINARANDQDSLRVIYERYFPSIYQFLRLRINDREQARDIAADVFVDFFVAIRGKNPPHTSLRAWLFRVARNKLYDHYGHQKQFPMTTLEDWLPISSEQSPEMEMLRSLRVERVQRVLRMLNAEQQEVLILRFGQELSLQETADLMDKSVSAVKSLQFRAVETLRALLDVERAE